MAEGISLDSLLTSLSGFGSASSNLADLSITGSDEKVRPLIDYGEFSRHIFFGDALRRYRAAIKRIEDKYPIGVSGSPDTSSLCAHNIYQVDKYMKESDGFDVWLIQEFSKNQPINGIKNSITAAATNDSGEIVPLIHIRRNSSNSITGSQTAMYDSVSARAENYEKENREQIDQTAGTGIFINSSTTSVNREIIVYGVTGERIISRSQKLSNLLPEVLFQGDTDNILEKTLAAIADQIDELRLFIENIPSVKRISYDEYDRTPNKFLPVMAREFGVELFEGADIDIARGLVVSTSGGYTSKQITNEVWNRILNNVMHLLKTKGTRETIESIGRLYGIDHNMLKTNEYSLFSGPVLVRDVEEVDVPALYTSGDVFVKTTSNAVTGSALAFDFPANQDFTLEFRISATADATCGSDGHVLFRHPLYTIDINGHGQASIKSVSTASLSSITELNSSSSFVRRQDQFINVVASRSGNGLNIFLMGLSASPSGGNDFVFINSGSTTNTDVALANFSSTGATNGLFEPHFPGSGSFTGYMHEVRSWTVPLSTEDMMEHTRNFESLSFQNSTASPRNATYGSLSAHYKLRENIILTGDVNFIVDSTTAGNSAVPISFESTPLAKRYRVFSNEKKIAHHYPAGFAADNDRIRQTEIGTNQKDIGYVSLSFNPINAINRQIKNHIQNIDLYDLMGTPEEHRLGKYTSSPFVEKWHDISAQWGLSVSASLTADGVTNNRFKSGGGLLGTGISGVSGSTVGVADLNTFIKAMDNFNDTLGGLFPFVKQFLPAKTNIMSEGIYVEPHMLERSKMKRRFGHREVGLGINDATSFTADGNIISYDEGAENYNSAPSVIEYTLTSLVINTHNTIGQVNVTGPGSANATSLMASASPTSTFQAYQYTDNNVQQTIGNIVQSTRQVERLNKFSSVNSPSFSQTRFGRFLPIKVTPATPAVSEVEITLDQLLISPTAASSATNGFISGRVRMLVGGRAFKTETPSLRFDFPVSADGTNLFVSEVGDIDAGQGREIKEKDVSITMPLDNEDIQFKITLHDVVTSLSAVNGGRSVTQLIVNDTISGSIGIVPVKITNLFNDATYVFRVGINSDTNRDRDLITQITQQGVEKLTS